MDTSYDFFFFFDIYCGLLIVSTVKKDTAIEIAKKREQERQRLEKLAETSRLSRYRRRSRSRSYSRSPPRYFILPYYLCIKLYFMVVGISTQNL